MPREAEMLFMGGRLKGTAHCHALLRDTGRKTSPGNTCRDVRCPAIMDALTTMRWRRYVILLVCVCLQLLFAHGLKLRPYLMLIIAHLAPALRRIGTQEMLVNFHLTPLGTLCHSLENHLTGTIQEAI